MRTLEYTVPPQEAGRRLEYVLRAHFELSEHRLRSLKFADCILLDGAPAHVGRAVAAGQTVMVQLRDEGAALAPYDLPLRVPYRDADILIVDKPAPLPSIASARQDSATLENAVYACLGCPADFVYRPVSRLDKGTSGLMIVAKDAHIQHRLQALLHTPEFIRTYQAVVDGCPDDDCGVIDAPIGKEDAASIRRIVTASGKPSVTHYRVLKRGKTRTLVELVLETGRTHQIRVHMASIGCPVVGDFLYGTEIPQLPGRFALHASALTLHHPMTGDWLSLTSPLPASLATLLD